MKIGVIGLQGDIAEHISAVHKAMREENISGEVVWIRKAEQINGLDRIILPGGESTTIGKLIVKAGIDVALREVAQKGTPIMGTCAGLVLLANEGDDHVVKTGQVLLGLMDIKIKRNAFGRQPESFETDLDISELGSRPFRGVFIRAPAIEKAGKNVQILAKFEDKIVAARQKNLLVTSFHPELTDDTRFHSYFLRLH
ncbi:MAG: pyridoxal 5'-phosphate synthase glutaminase subunit PdxT [Euryarchaeota archaeon]|nr:pyridoxal 5'-phosphate synthase glutaminase subunit PdxT [Euryarchaeota archaeon]